MAAAEPLTMMKFEQAQTEARRLLEEGVLVGSGGPEWEPLRRRVRTFLEAHAALIEIG